MSILVTRDLVLHKEVRAEYNVLAVLIGPTTKLKHGLSPQLDNYVEQLDSTCRVEWGNLRRRVKWPTSIFLKLFSK